MVCANINSFLLQGFETPLHFACKFGCPDVVNVLCSHPDTDKICKNKDGQKPCDVRSSVFNCSKKTQMSFSNFYSFIFSSESLHIPMEQQWLLGQSCLGLVDGHSLIFCSASTFLSLSHQTPLLLISDNVSVGFSDSRYGRATWHLLKGVTYSFLSMGHFNINFLF